MPEPDGPCVDCGKPCVYEDDDSYVFWEGQNLLWVCGECNKVDPKISNYHEEGGQDE